MRRDPDGRIGCSPADPDFAQNPYPAYAVMRAQGPCFFWSDYGIWCFPGYREVDAILRDRRFGRQIEHVMSRSELGLPPGAPGLDAFHRFEAHSLLQLEPPAHTRLRRLVNRAFVSRQIEILRPQISALAHELIDAFAAQRSVELIRAYAEVLPVIIIARLLGVPESMSQQLLEWSHSMVAMYQFNRDATTECAAERATREFSAFLTEHITARRRSPADDLITRLIAAEESGDRLSAEEMISTCILLLNAGHEATVHTIANAVKALLEHRIDTGYWFADLERTARLVEELLRFDPPLHMFTRYVLEELDYGGRHFAPGDEIGLMLGAANHDPSRFADPEQLNPERGGQGQLAFGAGIHFCLGAPLARLEMQLALPALFERLPKMRFDGEPRYADRYHFHGLERLDLRW